MQYIPVLSFSSEKGSSCKKLQRLCMSDRNCRIICLSLSIVNLRTRAITVTKQVFSEDFDDKSQTIIFPNTSFSITFWETPSHHERF